MRTKSVWLKLLIVIGFLVTHGQGIAQTDSAQKQVWPEADIYYRINERFRLYSQLSGTKSNSSYTDGTIGVYLDYFARPWLKERKNDTEMNDSTLAYYWWFRTGYSYSNSPPGDKQKTVNIFETETNNMFLLPGRVILQTRNRLDWRWVNGNFQPIYRPRVKFIKNLKTEYLTFNAYLWSEYFFYLNDHADDQLRLTIGTQIKVTKIFQFEVYYLHQFQHQPSVQPLNAIGFIIDVYLKSKSVR